MTVKKLLPLLGVIIFFIIIFFLSVSPLRNLDMWFHLKSGEIFAKNGVIFHDVFSFTATNRFLSPYEWLFQVTIYYIQQVFGFEAIKYFVALMGTLQVFVAYSILRQIFKVNRPLALFLCWIAFTFTLEFITARPYIAAYTFVFINVYFIFQYFFNNRNLLWLTLPITLAWANLHGSIFLDIGLFGSYSALSWLNYLKYKQGLWLKKSKVLSIYTVATVILTILPPLGFTQYRLLWTFFQKRDLVTKYIEEWGALELDPTVFIFFSLVTIAVVVPFLLVVIKKRQIYQNLWVLPLLSFVLFCYMAIRNLALGYISLILVLGWTLTQIDFRKSHIVIKSLYILLLGLLLGMSAISLEQKRSTERLYYPVKATQFIIAYDLKGHMFNEFGYGGYLLYHLYPKQKVFIDGRTDIYLCCEMPTTLELSYKKNLPDDKYKKLIDTLWEKYDISFVIMRSQKHSVLRKIARILTDDPDWKLVFWDDDSQLFVRNDGKNPLVLSLFGAEAATPYNKLPYHDSMEEKALKEYLNMISVADSAKSRNAIGYIYLRQKKYAEAKIEFEKAIQLDPTNESPYMNLGELAAKDQNFQEAIDLYANAKNLAPDRGLIYIRLGQLTIASTGDVEAAKKIWEEGLKKTIDEDAKEQLKSLLAH